MANSVLGPLVIVGAGGHAKVIVDLLRAAYPAVQLIGFTDRDSRPRTVAGLPVLGDDDELGRLRANGVALAFVALGDNAVRTRLGARLRELDFGLPQAVSPRASLSPSAQIGAGVAVMAGAVINAEAVIGDLAIVNSAAVVEHDCRIGAAAHIGPGCAVAGGVRIGPRTLLGVGVSVVPDVTLGADVVVGAGACVICDLPDGVRAWGVPARTQGAQP